MAHTIAIQPGWLPCYTKTTQHLNQILIARNISIVMANLLNFFPPLCANHPPSQWPQNKWLSASPPIHNDYLTCSTTKYSYKWTRESTHRPLWACRIFPDE